MSLNGAAHFSFLHARLMNFFSAHSFALKIRQRIGNEIDAYFEPNDFDDGYNDYRYCRPVESLFLWIEKDGGLDAEWMAEDDGSYLNDKGEEMLVSGKPVITGIEQLAAYGLWFLDVELPSCGTSEYDENRVNLHGFREVDLIEHRASCLLNAYQALVYAERMISKNFSLDAEESKQSHEIDFSELNARADERRRLSMLALDAKHAHTRRAQEFVKREWEEKKAAYEGNKSAFARDYVQILANQFTERNGDPFKITEKQLREVWLSDTPTARKRAC